MLNKKTVALFCFLGFLFSLTNASAQTVLFSDDMSVGTGWQFSHFGGIGKPGVTDISEADFGFDYSAFGIPEAPNSEVGDTATSGLRLAVNTPGLWAGDQVAAVYEDASFTGQYTFQVDIWLNWSAINGSGSGTTEHVGAMAGFKVDDAQSTFTPGQNGAGFLYSSDGDVGCSASLCDFMLVKDSARLDLDSGQFGESGFGGGNQRGYNNTNSNGNLDLPALFPSFNIATATNGLNGTGSQPAGALGFQWVTATLEVDATATGSGSNGKLGTVQVTLESHSSGNSFVLGTIDNSVEDDPFDGENTEERAANLEGGVGLMLTDYFTSAPTNPNLGFALFDNVRVVSGISVGNTSTLVPEPATFVLFSIAAGSYVFCNRRRKGVFRKASVVALLPMLLLASSTPCTRGAQPYCEL